MKCPICRYVMNTDGYTTIVLERAQTTLVFKNVPKRSQKPVRQLEWG